MEYETIRRIVEEEVLKALSNSPSTPRLKRPVISESMILQAKRRGSKLIEIPPAALITPAARDRADTLGIKIKTAVTANYKSQDVIMMIEAVMSSVAAYLNKNNPSIYQTVGAIYEESQTQSQTETHYTSLSYRHRINDRKLITTRDIENARLGDRVIKLNKKDIITPLARDLAEKIGVKIVDV